ncbi:MAG TPA: aldo/keto reductase, partial [Spirochaetia bacterium]
QIHQPVSFSPIPVQMREMAKLLKEKKIRSVGVSNFSAAQMTAAHETLAAEGIALASNQVRFNLLDRSIEKNGVLDAAKRLGVTIIAWSPLAQGVLSGKFHEDPSAIRRVSTMRRFMNRLDPAGLARSRQLVDELRLIARSHGVSPAQVALAWTVGFHDGAVVAIPGATRPEHATQSAVVLGLALSPREMTRIDELSRPLSGL